MKNIIYILLLCIIIITLCTHTYEAMTNWYELPKIAWSYWNNENLPEQIQHIVDNNREKLAGWKYIIINKNNEADYINSEDKPSVENLSVEHYSDWIRLYLIKKYGGVWIDISIILNDSLEDIYNKSITSDSELTGFRGKHFETSYTPVIENWFIMAPKGSEVIRLWLEEYEKAINMGFLKYKEDALNNNVNFQNIFGDNKSEVYLTQHGCLQTVFQKRLNRIPKMHLEDAAESMFKIHWECSWDNQCLRDKINDTSYSKKVPYIKLRGGDRDGLNLKKYFEED